RAARAFGEYLSHTHPENRNGSGCTDKPDPILAKEKLGLIQPALPSISVSTKPTCLSLEHSFAAEEDQKTSFECTRVYTISSQHGMLMSSGRGSKESLELDILKENHHTTHHHAHHHHHLSQPPLQTSVSAHNIRSLGEGAKGEAECSGLACDSCSGAPSRSQGSLDLESTSREAGKQHRRLERMWSVDRIAEDTNWFPKENMFTFQTATTTIQALMAFRGFVQRKRREREQDTAEVILRNFRKHLRMVGSRRIKAQTFAERRSKSFSRSWSDPTPLKTDSPHEAKDSGDLQASTNALEDGALDDALDWEEEKEMERLACEGDDFVPPKIMLISSKVPKAEYIPTIIRRDDPSIIPILYYDVQFMYIHRLTEEIDKKLTAYRRGSKFWRMLIFCQGGPGHLYLLKNKVATFAKVEKEEDMSQFWRRLSRFMSKVNPEPNVIHIMGCYVLGNPNGEKLFQKLKNLMRPYSVEFESPLELSAQGKEMIEMYFDFRLYRLWKTRQHSKLLDYEDLL
uniref:NMDA receptor synaptonuclear signaling and neuronal migration factor n=1 Tax=Poecilia formosa TaxID=48698 RepID=A0A096MG97_POEFO